GSEIRRHRKASRGVYSAEVTMEEIELARPDDLEHGLSVAEAGESQKPDPLLVPKPAKAIEQGAKHLVGRQAAAVGDVGRIADPAVVVEDVDRGAIQTVQAGV